MRGAALSDTHLGFRAFQATIEGRNAREVDTEAAWFSAIAQVVGAQPDLVTIAGDVFDHIRVSMFSVKAFRDGIRQIVEQTEAVVVILQGNHDAPRTADTETPLVIPDDLERVHIVLTPKRIRFDTSTGEKVSVACYPFVARGDGESYKLDPDPEADVNILCMHAAVKGDVDGDTLPFFYGSGGQALDVGREAERWDCIHVGDYHEFTRLHPDRLAFYPGSLERTSSNIWQEHAPKGWVLYDTVAEEMVFNESGSRAMADYEYRDLVSYGLGVNAEGLNDALVELAEADLAGLIVRLKVEDFPREEREHIDWSVVREIKGQALHFYLDIRYATREVEDLGDRRERDGGLSLADEAGAFFSDDDAEVQRLAFHYLDVTAEVEEVETVVEDEPGVAQEVLL